MSELAISAEGLWKQYRIGGRPAGYQTLRESITGAVAGPFRALRTAARRRGAPAADEATDFYALRDVSFEVRRGEVVGVIGRNGAGKSTLLKILSRITEPTRGAVDIHGRVGSLLEVGTGFHPELSGRENTYLNGAILGMRRTEIDRKFDEIVEFAGVSKFIDTPVKHYSSGMYLRLAFSVAAHLDPEILLVDEVLAVGDAAFQKKCLGKMGDVAARGRTVLFVSHNLGAVKELCHTAIVLGGGEVSFRGPVVSGIALYTQALAERSLDSAGRGTKWPSVTIDGRTEGDAATLAGSEPFSVDAWLNLDDDFDFASLFCTIDDDIGNLVVHQRIDSNDLESRRLAAGRYRVRIGFPPLWLAPGVYRLYCKFIGRTTGGDQQHQWSAPVLLDVTGNTVGLRNATLAPHVRWTVARHSPTLRPTDAMV